jgi:homoserine dehydrogenase
VLVGHGNVGSTLIEQILDSSYDIQNRKRIHLKIIAIANSKNIVFNKGGFGSDWRQKVLFGSSENTLQDLFQFVKENQFENLVLVDNTASKDFVKNYPTFVENGFDIVSSNKIFNTLPIQEYRNLRKTLDKNKKRYLYETNVGAGLPLIDTIKLLHLSGENITRIKGVFSGSLSYIFNNFSVRDEKFSTIVKEAMDKGFTEPDPREDLSGNDVARKLLILARELDLINEFSDINIQNLIPENLGEIDKDEFISRLGELDAEYQSIKENQEPNHVLRYVGDLHGDLNQDKGILDVKLVSVPASSALGQLKGSDSIFEIYTESYGENPIVIMGAGAGAKVTARGVFGDILRLC